MPFIGKTIIFIIGLTLVTCREIDEFLPSQEAVSLDFSGEFSDASDTLTIEITGMESRIIKTPRGTEFILKGEMFQYPNGDFCPCEKVMVRIIELDKKRDYMVHMAPTMSADRLLISAGAYYVEAFYQKKPLVLAPPHQLCFFLPSKEPDPEMEIFYGTRTGNSINWTRASDVTSSNSSVRTGQWQYNDTSSFIIGYECFSDRLEWVNVDKFASTGPTNPVCLKLDPSYTGENTVLFALVSDANGILHLPFTSQGFCLANMPEGLKVKFIAVHKKDNDRYEWAEEEVRIEKNHFQSLDFIPKTLEEVKTQLNKL